jgi:23S rRNA pseudouridine1911/1915/1917 synthase
MKLQNVGYHKEQDIAKGKISLCSMERGKRMLDILYEDDYILVCVKPVGIESQSSRSFEPDMVSQIKNYLSGIYTCGKPPYVGVIHRLDKPVGGIMVYAKNPFAAVELSKELQAHKIRKKYYAVLCGKPVDNVGKLVDYLWKDGKTNTSKVVTASHEGAKRAELNYRLIAVKQEDQLLSLVEVELITGRHHQIRVQFSHLGFPLWGDNRYRPEVIQGNHHGRDTIGLYAYELKFQHPKTKKELLFQKNPTEGVFQRFSDILE